MTWWTIVALIAVVLVAARTITDIAFDEVRIRPATGVAAVAALFFLGAVVWLFVVRRAPLVGLVAIVAAGAKAMEAWRLKDVPPPTLPPAGY